MVEKDARKKIGLSRWDDFMKFMTNKTITINDDGEIDFNTSDVNYFLGVVEVKTIDQQFDEAKESTRKAVQETRIQVNAKIEKLRED